MKERTFFTLEAWLKDRDQKVENSKGEEVRIICWDREGDWPIIALTKNRLIGQYNESGVTMHFGGEVWEPELFIVQEWGLTEFEQGLVETIEEFLNRAVVTDSVQDYVTKVAPNLLDLARKEVINDVRDEAYLKGKEDGKDELLAELEKPGVQHIKSFHEGVEVGKKEALKNMPKWRPWGNGACGNSDGFPIAIVKSACGYELASCLGIGGEEYIMLSELDKLPHEEC